MRFCALSSCGWKAAAKQAAFYFSAWRVEGIFGALQSLGIRVQVLGQSLQSLAVLIAADRLRKPFRSTGLFSEVLGLLAHKGQETWNRGVPNQTNYS